MRWGCCGSAERMQAVSDAGYDYAELPVRALLPDCPDDAFGPVQEGWKDYDIRPEAFNVFVPAALRIVGEAVDFEALTAHVGVVLRRAASVGGEVVVFGSGGARNAPEGFPPGRAYDQVVRFCRMAGEAAGRYGIVIAIEPLTRQGCNMINTVAEAVRLARDVDRREVGVLADLYHMEVDAEPWQHILEAAPFLRHVHLPVPQVEALRSEGRGFDHGAFLKTLKEAGYDGRISVEDNSKRFVDFGAEAGPVRERLAELWEKAWGK